MYISISNSRYAEITRKKGNFHFNVNFMPLYDINDSRIIDMFTKGLYFNVPANKYFNKKYSNTLLQFESDFFYQHIFKNRLEISISY